mmetsp:Transcript_342/g.1178  ORF Transcript_342/g.1178 Transcript_342/m.1178 type:complete len:238 (-) Transcript_342:28-741(-)
MPQRVRGFCSWLDALCGSRRNISNEKGSAPGVPAEAVKADGLTAVEPSLQAEISLAKDGDTIAPAGARPGGWSSKTTAMSTEPPLSKRGSSMGSGAGPLEDWNQIRAQWWGKAVEEVATFRYSESSQKSLESLLSNDSLPQSAAKQGALKSLDSKDLVTYRSKDSDVSWSLEAALIALEAPYPPLKQRVKLSVVVAHAVSIWAQVPSDSDDDEDEDEAGVHKKSEPPPDLSADFVLG